MRKISVTLSLLVTLIGFSACQKEVSFETPGASPTNPAQPTDPNAPANPDEPAVGGGSLPGTYDLIDVAAKGYSRSVTMIGGITSTSTVFLDYRSIDNAGTYVFTDKTLTVTGQAYRIDAMQKMETSITGLPKQESEIPAQASYGPMDATASYELKGQDSMVAHSTIMAMPGGGLVSNPEPGAFKYYFKGDTLFLVCRPYKAFSENGIQSTIDLTGTIRLKKKS